MKVKELIKELLEKEEAIPASKTNNLDNLDIAGIAYDSRGVKDGYAFVVYQGFKDSAHKYIDSAIKNGAKFLIVEKSEKNNICYEVPHLLVKNGRKALAILAQKFYNNPASKMKMIGITGTFGKTTSTWLLKSIYETAGLKTGLVGTVKYSINNEQVEAHHTTPESLDLHKLLADFLTQGAKACVMEVSSHALELWRVYGIDFNIAGFTVLERDHLDFHETVEKYAEAKLKLFSGLKKDRIAVLNKDSYVFEQFKSKTSAKIVSYGITPECDIFGELSNATLEGIEVKVKWNFKKDYERVKNLQGEGKIYSPLVGPHNLSNILLVTGCALADGMEFDVVCQGIKQLQAVPGRFEIIGRIIIDYAHTPGAMEAALRSAKAITPGRLICVFGCGGDRDQGKRALMGKIASENADYVILTTDNPRSEDPGKITKDIISGITKYNYEIILDRKTAIQHAVERSSNEDVIMLIGKGHESYQILGELKVPWDERAVAKEALEKYGNNKH